MTPTLPTTSTAKTNASEPPNPHQKSRGADPNEPRSRAVTILWDCLHSVGAWARQLNPYLLLLLPAFYLATLYATGSKYPISASYAPNVIWSHEWAEQFRNGIVYPRWMEHPYSGLGTPTFNFYGPLCMYATLPFSVGLGLSISTSILYSFWTALFLMSIGVARLGTTIFAPANRWLSVLIAILALLSPYALLNAYSRGALAETWAMAVFPWLLATLLESLDSPRLAARAKLIVATAAFALCHPPSLLLGTCAIGFALLVTARSQADLVRVVLRGGAPMLIAFALDAFYLLPALGDQKHVNIAFMTTIGGPTADQRFLVTELGRLSLKFADGYDGLIVPAFSFYCLTMVLVLWCLRRYGDVDGTVRSRRVVFLLACAAIAALMMSDLSRGIYTLLPVFKKTQFSWRWMVVMTITALPAWGYFIYLVHRPGARRTSLLRIPAWLITVWAATNAFSTSMTSVDWNRADADLTDRLLEQMARAGHEADLSATPIRDFRGLLHINAKQELVVEDVAEYQPTTKSDGHFPPRTFDFVEWVSGSGSVSDIRWQMGHRQFAVDSTTGGQLLVRTSAWLGWRLTVNETRSVGDEGGDWGRMVVRVPPGHSTVKIDYVGTPNQRHGQLVSILVLALLFGYAGLKRHLVRRAIA
jgi:hypothetical protein